MTLAGHASSLFARIRRTGLGRNVALGAVGLARGGIPEVARGDYESLRWSRAHEAIFRHGSPALRNRLAKMVARSSWHYVAPPEGSVFGISEFEQRLDGYREHARQFSARKLLPLIHRDDRVLEFGCGIGVFGSSVAAHCRSYLGVDVSRGAIAAATHWSRDQENMSFLVNNGFDLDGVASDSVDFMYSHQTIQHLDKIHAYGFLLEFFRILVPGGTAWLHVPTLDLPLGWDGFVRQYEHLARYRADALPVWHIRHYTASEVRLKAVKVGFEVVDIVSSDPFPDSYYCYLRKPLHNAA